MKRAIGDARSMVRVKSFPGGDSDEVRLGDIARRRELVVVTPSVSRLGEAVATSGA